MERGLWLVLYHLALRLDKLTRAQIRPAVIVGVFAWAVLHDRPVSWACERRNWPEDLLHEPYFRLPSQSTMSRRLRRPETEEVFSAASELLTELWSFAMVKFIDAKPLPIGGYSKDADARWGRATKSFAKGYKLFAVYGAGPMPLVWGLGAMNVSENQMARLMIPLLRGGGYLVGDSIYDSNPLHQLATARGYQLVAPRKKKQSKGLGHRPHTASRLRALELLAKPFGQQLFNCRTHIERSFGWLTSCAAGLGPLPAWVRRFPRVRLWVYMKLILNALRHATPAMLEIA